jgi:DNA-binding response OmpR family regulator
VSGPAPGPRTFLAIKHFRERGRRRLTPFVGTETAASSDVDQSRRRILVADDEPALLAAIREYLRCCGWDVDAVDSAEKARHLLETRAYMAVITDLRFAGAEGEEGLAIVKAARGLHQRVPVVVMTGHGTPEAEAEARRLGADLFVPKPVALWELAALVRGWGAA